MIDSPEFTGKSTLLRGLLLVLIFSLGLAGWAGKSDVTPVQAQKQAFDDLRSEIRIAIDDAERETKAIDIVEQMDVQFVSLRTSREERQAQFKKMNASYDTTRTEFDEFIEESNANIYRNHQQLLEHRQALMSITTPEEWTRILNARTEAIEAAFKSYNSI